MGSSNSKTSSMRTNSLKVEPINPKKKPPHFFPLYISLFVLVLFLLRYVHRKYCQNSLSCLVHNTAMVFGWLNLLAQNSSNQSLKRLTILVGDLKSLLPIFLIKLQVCWFTPYKKIFLDTFRSLLVNIWIWVEILTKKMKKALILLPSVFNGQSCISIGKHLAFHIIICATLLFYPLWRAKIR